MPKGKYKIKEPRTKEEWLDIRAGRTLADILKDKKGEYVLMFSPLGDVKVYLPKNLTNDTDL